MDPFSRNPQSFLVTELTTVYFITRLKQELEVIDTDEGVFRKLFSSTQHHKKLSTILNVSSDLTRLQMEVFRNGSAELDLHLANALDNEIGVSVDLIEFEVLAFIAAAVIGVARVTDGQEPAFQQHPLDTVAVADIPLEFVFGPSVEPVLVSCVHERIVPSVGGRSRENFANVDACIYFRVVLHDFEQCSVNSVKIAVRVPESSPHRIAREVDLAVCVPAVAVPKEVVISIPNPLVEVRIVGDVVSVVRPPKLMVEVECGGDAWLVTLPH